MDRQRALRELFKDASRIVEREYADRLLVDDVAARLHTSRRQLQRAYYHAGMPGFRDQLAATRMHRAAALLQADTPAPVGEIGQAVGYQSSSQFTKAFCRYHGITPTTYRAQI